MYTRHYAKCQENRDEYIFQEYAAMWKKLNKHMIIIKLLKTQIKLWMGTVELQSVAWRSQNINFGNVCAWTES